jgi:hypothetical protein
MTDLELTQWVLNQKNEWDVPDCPVVNNAVGFIMADIDERGAEGFVNMTAQEVVHGYIGATVTVSNGLMDQFNVSMSQEEMLDELGIDQSEKIDVKGLVNSLNTGMLDIMKSMLTYLELQELAYKFFYNEHEN